MNGIGSLGYQCPKTRPSSDSQATHLASFLTSLLFSFSVLPPQFSLVILFSLFSFINLFSDNLLCICLSTLSSFLLFSLVLACHCSISLCSLFTVSQVLFLGICILKTLTHSLLLCIFLVSHGILCYYLLDVCLVPKPISFYC